MSSRPLAPSPEHAARPQQRPAQAAPHGDAIPLGPGREFDAIARLVARWGTRARGIGDDCAFVSVPAGETLCASTDTSVEGVHFRRDWLTAREIGYRATAAALSDLAAVAATPLGVLVAVSLPDDARDALGDLGDGIGDAAAAVDAPVIGGDTTRGPALSLTVTVLGSTRAPVSRAGARVGDRVYVTGRLGGPMTALRALERGARPEAAHMDRFARPVARIGEARWLAGQGARALIDVSDGLAGDLGHVAAASGVRLEIDVDRVPVLPGVDALEAFASGEEYELVACVPHEIDVRLYERDLGTPLTLIGRVVEGPAGVLALRGGRPVSLPASHDHFSNR